MKYDLSEDPQTVAPKTVAPPTSVKFNKASMLSTSSSYLFMFPLLLSDHIHLYDITGTSCFNNLFIICWNRTWVRLSFGGCISKKVINVSAWLLFYTSPCHMESWWIFFIPGLSLLLLMTIESLSRKRILTHITQGHLLSSVSRNLLNTSWTYLCFWLFVIPKEWSCHRNLVIVH